jgi:beta-glucanase (GH16 family)
MSAPVFPKSAAPNRWLSASIAGSTLTGSDTTRDQLAANAVNVTLVGGALDDTYIAYGTSTNIVEQANGGIDTVITWGNSYTLGANVENLTLMGGANSTATGNTGNNILTGNDGNNRIVTGGGNDLLVGSKGADTYVPTEAANSVTWITGFKASGTTIDKIDLRGFGIDGFTGIQSRMAQVGSDLRIDLGNGQQVMLENMTKSELTAANFQVEASVATMPGMSDLVMTFADEFNTLNLYSTWSPDDGWGNRTLIGNQEEQLYVDPQYKGLGLNPFSVNNGVLTISAAKAPSSIVPQLDGYKYTSGMLSSDGSFTQQYGYFEIRAQVSDQQGMWPAFWLLPADGSWPPELDIMESVGKNPYSVSQSVHTETGSTSTKATIAPTDLSKGFHTYGMDWTASTITFYLDGQVTAQFATPSDMNKPMYMMVNLAVGGTWPGSPDATTDWSQANMKVDYIHVYQHGGTPTTPTTPDPVTSTPDPVTEVPPPVTPTPTPAKFDAVISHGFNPLDLSDSFKTDVADASSKTYTAADLDIRGIDPNTKVTVTNDDSGDITASVDSAWGSVKNVIIKSSQSGRVTIKNFVDAEVTLGNGDNTVSVTDSKRGSIVTGSGNDTISVTAKSDTNDINVMKINAGDGNNTVSFSGPSNAKTTITTGSGTDQITVSGQSAGTINAGAGNDRIVIGSTGITSVTGGAGNDIFEVTAGAKATITDFVAGQDSLVFNGIAASAVKVLTSGGNTVLDLGNGSAITLTGVSASEEALGLPSHALTAVISNNMNALDLSNSFTTSASGANTSTTYTASQMKLIGMDANATVTASYDANKNLTVTNKGVWNAVKNIAVDSDSSGGLTVNNFVDARIALGNGSNTVKVTSAKRGTITTGAGDDQISVTALSNGTTDNVMTINTGDGNDTVSFSGASNTKTAITSGSGSDQITISGQAGGSVNAGAGNDRIVIGTSGTVTAAGGAGQDVFEFIRGAHATISDFNAAEDSLVIRGGSASTVQLKAGTGSVMVDLGNGSSVTLAGVTVPTNTIHIAYA